MAKKTVTIKYTWKDILSLIEKEEGCKLKLSYLSINQTGDYDLGNYKETLNYIELEEVK